MTNAPNLVRTQSSAERRSMIEDLRTRGITDERVLQAMSLIPREDFVEPTFRTRAYSDSALPIGAGQTISQPYTVASMSQALEAEPGMSVLEIGTGSGYQAAVLSLMGLRVYSIERHRALHERARATLEHLGCNVSLLHGDGSVGWSLNSPYDRIIVTAGAPEVPTVLLKQLAPDGRLVIPIGDRTTQRMEVVVRHGDRSEYDVFDYGEYRFVPLIGRTGWSGGEEGGE